MERRCERVEKNSDGVLFSACDQTPYLSTDYHHSAGGSSKRKSLWAIARPDECHTFCSAKTEAWLANDGNLWAVAEEGGPAFGTLNERLAFFWAPSNETDPWHGHPVGLSRNSLPFRKFPPDELVKSWHESGIINFTTMRRIVKRRI